MVQDKTDRTVVSEAYDTGKRAVGPVKCTKGRLGEIDFPLRGALQVGGRLAALTACGEPCSTGIKGSDVIFIPQKNDNVTIFYY